mmetsp:Transcript_20871/g.34497  ORF Transcript_20871/g.34497 Transcript_20871/m.34497 type:complete len:88 (+) Transcript_20871:395-658(+)
MKLSLPKTRRRLIYLVGIKSSRERFFSSSLLCSVLSIYLHMHACMYEWVGGDKTVVARLPFIMKYYYLDQNIFAGVDTTWIDEANVE